MLINIRDITAWPWQNFSPDETNLACPCCGEWWDDPGVMDRLQAARNMIGKPIRVNSGHRCGIHNAHVGGAPLSQHKRLAFDISLYGHDRQDIITACRKVGFTGFGFYQTFLHVDCGRPRAWYGKGARGKWNG